MTPKVLALLKESDINPFTAIEVLGSSTLMLMCLIQELNSNADMTESFCGFFDKMKERIRTELGKARVNGAQKQDEDQHMN